MVIDIITIFPNIFKPVLGESILKRAQQKGVVKINVHNLRDFSTDSHKKVDDRPFGGGPGMVIRPEPIFTAVEYIKSKISTTKRGRSAIILGGKRQKSRIILLSPQGKRLDQAMAKKLSGYKHLILICGHYEGIDERVREYLVTDEVSIGDYVLTGGELPVMVLIDCVVRLLPGVLGKNESLAEESFSNNLLEYPQYTRPQEFLNMRVPKVLLSGDHEKIEQWRKRQAIKKTKEKRPDLIGHKNSLQ